ncbi:phosphoribosyl-AMP cyclohydrolase [Candidatus Kaiserbacteria bacterium]|nr:phosphoribosyl-AMP cyclohydrolase [Candidatus Kaiserbacteria bacterium]
MKVLKPNFEKRGGFVPVIVQDSVSKEVLMLAYQNEEAWRKSIRELTLTLFSTSRKKLWTKGETSGNRMQIVDVIIDCDEDALLYLVKMQGDQVACHTGARSCFYRFLLNP